jgi:hypothetical protein
VSRIETKFRNYELYFDEDKDMWRCHDLGLENKSLGSLKAALANYSKGSRAVNVPALIIQDGQIVQVQVTVLCEPEKHWVSNRQGYSREIIHCWIKLPNGKRTRKSKIKIENVYPLESRAELNVYISGEKEISALVEINENRLEGIGTHDADSLMLAAGENKQASKSRKKK